MNSNLSFVLVIFVVVVTATPFGDKIQPGSYEQFLIFIELIDELDLYEDYDLFPDDSIYNPFYRWAVPSSFAKHSKNKQPIVIQNQYYPQKENCYAVCTPPQQTPQVQYPYPTYQQPQIIYLQAPPQQQQTVQQPTAIPVVPLSQIYTPAQLQGQSQAQSQTLNNNNENRVTVITLDDLNSGTLRSIPDMKATEMVAFCLIKNIDDESVPIVCSPRSSFPLVHCKTEVGAEAYCTSHGVDDEPNQQAREYICSKIENQNYYCEVKQ